MIVCWLVSSIEVGWLVLVCMHAMYDDDDVGCEMILLYFGIKFRLVWVSYKKICGIRR